MKRTIVAVLVLAASVARGDEGPSWGPSRAGETPAWIPARGEVQAPPVPMLPAPQEPAPTPRTTAPMPLPAPKPAEPAKPAEPVKPAPAASFAPLPESGPILEPAPKGHFTGVAPIRHGTFGSPNLTLSRDYHVLDLFGAGLIADDANAIVPGEGPATDNYFVSAEYLLWWMKAGNIPVLATSGSGGSSFGYLGQPGTQTLLGPGKFGDGSRSGFRIRAGGWFDEWLNGCGLDGSFFFLGSQSESRRFDSGVFPTIARPFFAPNFNTEFAELVAFPGLSTGALDVNLDSRLWGADANVKWCVCRTCDAHTEWFAGYRHLNLKEDLTITETILAGATAPDPVGTRITVTDSFKVHNQFHGGQVGYASGRRWGRLSLDVRASVALGVTHQELEIAGSQVRLRPGQTTPDVFAGGLLAAGPNLGRFSDNKFSVVPEATITAGYNVTPALKLTVGYNFLFWSNVLRPGDQIDRVVDLSFVPNAPTVPAVANRPQPLMKSSDLWVQGISFGVEYRW